jgi:hypothetical protein
MIEQNLLSVFIKATGADHFRPTWRQGAYAGHEISIERSKYLLTNGIPHLF